MAYDFLKSTTYSNDPLAQGDFDQFIPSSQSTPLGAGFDDTSFDSDLVEMVVADEEAQSSPADPNLVEVPVVEEEPDQDPQIDMEILNMIFQEDPEAAPRQRAYTPPPPTVEEEEEPAPAPTRTGKVTPRIWQYGGEVPQYQRGGGVGRRFGSRFNSSTVDKLTEEGKQMKSAGITDVLDIPQKTMMYGLTGQYQAPSDWLQKQGYDNRWLGFSADVVFDPLNLVPFFKTNKYKSIPLSAGKKAFNTTLKASQLIDNTDDAIQAATRQTGGTLYADTYEQQRIGLNNPNYNTAVFNTKGTNTFRGLDNHQPVAITDGSKYKVLYGPQDTAKFTGKVYEKKMQFGGELRPETNEVKEFYNNYLNSANYTKRLNEQGYTNPQQAILDRLANIKPVTTSVDSLIGSQYNAPNYTVFYNPKDAQEFGFPKQSVLAHEYGHSVGASQGKYLANPNLELNQNEMNAFSTRNKLRLANTAGMTEQQKLDLEHDSRPSESKADLDALRFRLFQDKIYDTGTQEFNPEILKQAKEKYKDDNIVNRLFQNYSDEDLIYLMNHVAKNNKNTNRPIYG